MLLKRLNLFALTALTFVSLISCTPQGKDFATEACVRGNLNCSAPATTIDLVGGDEDRDSINVDGSGNDVGAVSVKSVRYGEDAVIEFIITNPKLNPLKDFTLEMTPQDAAFEVIDGKSQPSCTDNILTYQEKCSVAIKYKPGKVPPGLVNLDFKFKTITGGDFKFKSAFDPAVLIADFYIAPGSLLLPSTMVYSGAAGEASTSDIVIENTSSTTGDDLTIASLKFKSGNCSLLPPSSDTCSVGTIVTAKSANTCNIKVGFKPQTRGKHQCLLEILATNGTYRTYTFQGDARGLTSTTAQLDFGIVKTSATAITKSFTVNIESDASTTSASSCSSSLSSADSAFGVVTSPVLPATIAAAGQIAVTVTYTPQATAQSHRTDLVLSCNSRGGTFTLPLSAATTETFLTSNTSNLNFGDVLVGDKSSQTVTLTNTSSSETLTDLTNSLSQQLGEGFTVTGGTCGASLPPQQSCSVNIEFAPTSAGPSQNNLTSSGSQDSLSPSIAVSGNGAGLSSSQSSVDFGSLKPKSDRPGAPIVITNLASSKAQGCSISAASLKDTGFSIDESSTCLETTELLSEASCEIKPRFTAGTKTGLHEATLQMSCTKGGSVSIPLKALVTANMKLTIVPPSDINWTDRLVGITENVEFTFMNQDSQNLADLSLSKQGVVLPWSEIANTCGSSLSGGATCKYTLQYSPLATAGSEQTGSTNGSITAQGTDSDTVVAKFSSVAKKISSSQNSLSFGQVSTGENVLASTRIYFINPSKVDSATTCSLSSLTSFEISDTDCGASLASQSQCSVLVKLPSQSSSANLQETLSYTCAVGGRASVAVSAEVRKPATLAWSGSNNLGNLDLGQTKDQTLTLTHTGAGLDLPATQLLNSLAPTVGPFSLISNNCPTSLSAGSSCSVTVRYAPLVAGPHSASLTANSNIGATTITLSGTGIDASDRLSSPTTSVSIASALIGSTHTETVTLTNGATAGNSGTIAVTGLVPPWSSSGCHGSDLALGASCNITVTYQPTSIGTSTGTLNASATHVSKNFPLSGVATKVTGSLSSYDFGEVPLNTNRDSVTLQILNPSTLDDASSCVVSSEAPFTIQSETCTSSFPKSGSCNVVVRFPGQATEQLFENKKLSVTCGVGGTAEILLKGFAKDMPLATLTGNSLFGEWDLDNGVLTQVFTISNNNGSSISLDSPQLTGSSSFSITGNTCGATLGNGSSCSVTVAFDPSTAGEQTTSLSMGISDGTKSGTLITSLSGTGTEMDLLVTPDQLAFDPIRLGSATTQTKQVTITNNGSRTAHLSYSSLNSPWSTGGTCGTELAAQASCTIDITASAHSSAADHSSTFVITETQTPDTDTYPVALTAHTWNPPILAIKDTRAQSTYTSSDISLTDITGNPNDPNNIADLSPASRSVTFTVKNNVSPAFPLTNVGIGFSKNAGPAADPAEHMLVTADSCSGQTLDANEECTVTITYSPTAIREADSKYTLTVTGKDNTTDLTVSSLEVRGRSYKNVTLAEDFAPTSHSFTLIPSSTTEDTTLITLSNSGDLTATNLSFGFTGSSFTRFTTTANTCGTSLAANSSCQFKVRFAPAGTAVALNNSFNITSDQKSLMAIAEFKGASYTDDQGDSVVYPTYDGLEPEITSDANYFYITSKTFDDNDNYRRFYLQICPKNSTTGNIDSASCGVSQLSVAGEPFWAGAFGGYKMNPQVTAQKILVAVSNQQNDSGAANLGISTILVCDKSQITGSRTLDLSTDCTRINLHSVSVDQSSGLAISPIANKGAFTSMQVSNNKLVSAAQNSDGFSITACSYNDSAAHSSTLSGCKTYFKTGLGTDQAQYTDIAYDGTTLVMTAHRLNLGLYAMACTLGADNTLTCGAYEKIDDNVLTNGGDNMIAGAHPYVVIDSAGVLIASQQGSEKSQGLRLAKCSISSLSFTCSNKTVAQAAGSSGFGLNPSLKVIQRGSSRVAWIQSLSISDYASPSGAQKKISIYACDVTDFNGTSCSARYFQQTDVSDAPIYAREMDLDLTRKIITIPFTAGDNYKTGVLSLGLLPEL